MAKSGHGGRRAKTERALEQRQQAQRPRSPTGLGADRRRVTSRDRGAAIIPQAVTPRTETAPRSGSRRPRGYGGGGAPALNGECGGRGRSAAPRGKCGVRYRGASAEGESGVRCRVASAEAHAKRVGWRGLHGERGGRARRASAEGECGVRRRVASAEGESGGRERRASAECQ